MPQYRNISPDDLVVPVGNRWVKVPVGGVINVPDSDPATGRPVRQGEQTIWELADKAKAKARQPQAPTKRKASKWLLVPAWGQVSDSAPKRRTARAFAPAKFVKHRSASINRVPNRVQGEGIITGSFGPNLTTTLRRTTRPRAPSPLMCPTRKWACYSTR